MAPAAERAPVLRARLPEGSLIRGVRTGWNTSLQPTRWTSQRGGTLGLDAPAAMTAGAWNHLAFVPRAGAKDRGTGPAPWCPTAMPRHALSALLLASPWLLGAPPPAAAQRYNIGLTDVVGVLEPEHTPRAVRAGAVVAGAVALTAVFELPIAGLSNDTMVSLALPPDGVATGARARQHGLRVRAELLRADVAGVRFSAVSERSGAGAPAAAVLVAHGTNAVSVHVAWPHREATSLTLELDVSAPTCVHGGRRLVGLPGAWATALGVPASSGAAAQELEAACGRTAEAWHPLAVAPTQGAPVHLVADRLALGAEHVARLEVAVGDLGEIPADLATVIVADASRSLSDRQRQLQRELIAAYARAAPTSQLQVVTYARAARPVLAGWRAARAAAADVDAALAALAPANGSNVDAGLAEAAAWLGRARGTRRVVLLTDELLARRLSRLPAASLGAALPAGTLVHVVALDQTNQALARDDAAALAPLAAATAGLSARIGERMAGTALDARALLRPVTLDAVRITAPGWRWFEPGAGAACPTSEPTFPKRDHIPEGGGCTWWARGAAAAGDLTVEGWLWGRKVAIGARPTASPAAGVAIARTLSAGMLPHDLNEAVYAAARAVTPAHSLLAIWGGAGAWPDRPTGGAHIHGTVSTWPRGGGAGTYARVTASGTQVLPEDLAPQLRHVLALCGLAGVPVEARVESTRDEIVDVEVSLPAAHAARRACVEDAIWDVPLQLAHPLPSGTHRASL